MFNDRFEQLALGASAAHGQEKAPWLAILHPSHASSTIDFDVFHDLVVDVVADIVDRIRRDRVHDLARLIETTHSAETIVARGRLHAVLGAFGQLEGHGPVVEHHVDDVGHAPSDCAHAVPHVGGKHRHIGRQSLVQVLEQFAHLVVFDVGFEKAPGPTHDPGVEEPAQTRQGWLSRSHRLPHVFIEQPAPL